MCRYYSICHRCNYEILVEVEQTNMQDAQVNISSDCPTLASAIPHPIKVDAMHEVISTKTESSIYNILSNHHDVENCSAYDSIKSAMETNLGRYYELA